jgi:hypothetical protein
MLKYKKSIVVQADFDVFMQRRYLYTGPANFC